MPTRAIRSWKQGTKSNAIFYSQRSFTLRYRNCSGNHIDGSVYKHDKVEREPIGLIIKLMIAVLFEEALQYFVFDLAIWKSEEFDHTFDAIVYSVAFSAGYALFETAMYISWEKSANMMMHTAIVRDFTSVPMHLFCAVYMGYYLGRAKQYEKRGNKSRCHKYRILGFVVPFLLHGFYDFCCLSNNWLVEQPGVPETLVADENCEEEITSPDQEEI